MKKFIIMLFLAGPAALLFEGCFPECHCPKVATYFKADKIKSKIIEYYGIDSFQIVSDSGSIQQGNLAIKIDSDFSYYGKTKSSNSTSFFNNALACKCLNSGYGGTTKKLKAIHVTSAEAFNSNFIANDTITSITTINGLSVNSYIRNYNLGEYTKENNAAIYQFTQIAAIDLLHQLNIVYEYDTYSLSTVTNHFIIKP